MTLSGPLRPGNPPSSFRRTGAKRAGYPPLPYDPGMGRKSKKKSGGLPIDRPGFRAYLRRMEAVQTNPTKPKAVGYVRVSSKRQRDEGGSLDDQREAIIRHAVLSGFDLVGTFEDGGVSGGKDEGKRPGLSAALDAIKSGAASVLVVTHVDRLARESDLAGYLRVTVKRAGGTLAVIAEAKDDPYRKLLDSMLAEMERLRARERMRFTYAEKRRRGEHVGPVPFGFRLEGSRLVPEPSERAEVRRVLAQHRAGKTLRQIAADLNERGVPTRRGRPWSATHVDLILRREER